MIGENCMKIKLEANLNRYCKTRLAAQLQKAMNDSAVSVVFDCSETTYMDLEIMKFILMFAQLLHDQNRNLFIADPHWKLKNILKHTRVDQAITLTDNYQATEEEKALPVPVPAA